MGEFEEWGNPAIEEQYRWMRAYCPYTNLEPGAYPAILVRTSFNDSQVMYWEPAKYVSRTLDRRPAPAAVDQHGGGTRRGPGRYDRLKEIAETMFILKGEGRMAKG